MEDPRVFEKYIDILSKSFHEHDLFNRMNKLHTSTYQLSPYFYLEYEKIDDIACDLMEKAESKCRKLCTEEISWSPAYKKVGLLLQYWYLCRAHINGRNSNIRQQTVLQNKLKVKYNYMLTKEQINKEL